MNRKLSLSALKIIGAAAMLLDHTALILAGNGLSAAAYYILRGIGRIAFPIFCFVLVEGFVHTRSLGKYITRIGVLALISEIPYDLMVSGKPFDFTHNNILFTFTIALIVLWLISKCEDRGVKGFLLIALITTAGMAASWFIKSAYSWKCIMLAVFMYMSRSDRRFMYISGGIVLLIDCDITDIPALSAFLPIHFYNGTKGKFPGYLFYIFYPVHMALLGIVRIFII